MSLTPEEEKQLKELLNNPLDFYRRSFPGFEFSSGHETLGHGNAEFCLTTDSGQMIHFYDHQVNAALTSQAIAGSVTSVGEISSSSTNGVDALVNDSLVGKIIHIMEKVKLFFKSICAPV